MIDRRGFIGSGLVAGIAVAASASRAETSAAPPAIRNVVLVHGAYADGSSWSGVIPLLQRAGLAVTAVQNPLQSLAEDCAFTARVLAEQDGPTVLVAHSYGGEVITQTGIDPKVAALVYVAARAPDAAEDYTALARRYPPPPASRGLVHGGGQLRLSRAAFLADFANGVDPAQALALYAVQGRVAETLFQARVTQAAWRQRPSFYAVSTRDRTIDPGLQRFMAARMKATTIEVDAGHLSLVSHPREIASLILRACRQPAESRL